MDTMPLNALLGPARIIESQDPESVKAEELVQYDIQPGERILFKTQNSEKAYKSYELYKDYIYIDPDAAQFLVEKKISVVGIDYIAAGSYHHREKNVKTHMTFFENGVWVLEAINLAGVRPGPCELACLPLRIRGGDAAPARAIVRPL
jgi:arylformamidase